MADRCVLIVDSTHIISFQKKITTFADAERIVCEKFSLNTFHWKRTLYILPSGALRFII